MNDESKLSSKLSPNLSMLQAITGPELVFGLAGAVGTNLSLVTEVLIEELKRVRYATSLIRISHEMHAIDSGLPSGGPLDEHYDKHMTAGTEIRESLGRGDALALLAANAIATTRQQLSGSETTPVERHAYVVRSLKHPDEVKCLRKIYGRMFFMVAGYSSRQERREALAYEIARSRFDSRPDKYSGKAEDLIARDEEEAGKKLGQQLRETFQLADVFVNCTDRASIRSSLQRFVELIFGHPFHTPTRGELSMFHARASALRSADLSRQVGAVIVDAEGSLLAAGCNEVPKSRGGAYWATDTDERRDFRIGHDPSALIKQEMLEEVLHRLSKAGWLADKVKETDARDLAKEAVLGEDNPLMRGARLMDLLEFGRVVHAEMAALMDAARRGISVQGATLYCTTFPCHMCVRHMIAAGISQVFYIEPYPKSLAKRLHSDSLSMDDSHESGRVKLVPFTGIAPNRFAELFAMHEDRKTKDGFAVKWDALSATTREKRFVLSYLLLEDIAAAELTNLLAKAGKAINQPTATGTKDATNDETRPAQGATGERGKTS